MGNNHWMRLTTLTGWLDRLSPVRSALLVMGLLAVVYVPTATWHGEINVDASAAAAPVWQLAAHGNVYVEDLPSEPLVCRRRRPLREQPSSWNHPLGSALVCAVQKPGHLHRLAVDLGSRLSPPSSRWESSTSCSRD